MDESKTEDASNEKKVTFEGDVNDVAAPVSDATSSEVPAGDTSVSKDEPSPAPDSKESAPAEKSPADAIKDLILSKLGSVNDGLSKFIVPDQKWIPAPIEPLELPGVAFVPFKSSCINIPLDITLSSFLTEDEWKEFLADTSRVGYANEKLDSCYKCGICLPCLGICCGGRTCCLFRAAETVPVQVYQKYADKWKDKKVNLFTIYRPGSRLLALWFMNRAFAQTTFGFLVTPNLELPGLGDITAKLGELTSDFTDKVGGLPLDLGNFGLEMAPAITGEEGEKSGNKELSATPAGQPQCICF